MSIRRLIDEALVTYIRREMCDNIVMLCTEMKTFAETLEKFPVEKLQLLKAEIIKVHNQVFGMMEEVKESFLQLV
jgi:hypothetical protein